MQVTPNQQVVDLSYINTFALPSGTVAVQWTDMPVSTLTLDWAV